MGSAEAAFEFASEGLEQSGAAFYAHMLAAHYENGSGVKRDLERAESLWRQAARSGEWTARYDLAGFLFRESDGSLAGPALRTYAGEAYPQEAYRHLHSLAEDGYAPAMVSLWRLLGPGDSGENEALLTRAVEIGHPTALYLRLVRQLEQTGEPLCLSQNALEDIAATGQIGALAVLTSCARDDEQAAKWAYAFDQVFRTNSFYGEIPDLTPIEALMSDPALDQQKAKEAASAWYEERFAPEPPQCQTICFTAARGYYIKGS